MYRLEIIEEEEDVELQGEGSKDSIPLVQLEDEQPLISLQALHGINSFQTMRVAGKLGSQLIHTLIDSGSTHNFLDSTTTKKLRCELLRIPLIVVAVADGAQLTCQTMCKKFSWTMDDIEYEADIFIVPLGSCDMVLGVQLLATLGSIMWNFEELTMKFVHNARKHLLQGIKRTNVAWAEGRNKGIPGQIFQLYAVQVTPKVTETTYALNLSSAAQEPQLLQLLQEYADVFDEPKSLPPLEVMITRSLLRKVPQP